MRSPTGRMSSMNDGVDWQQWPRPGHVFAYKTKIAYEGFEPFEFELSVTSGAEQMDLSSVMVGRIGGHASADIALRQELYFLIGSITVASGHIEAAMKRLILTLQGHRTRQFSLVDKTWTDLQKILTKESQKADGNVSTAEVRECLKVHLRWAEDRRLKTHRDDFIHGSVWNYAMPLVLVSRFHRKQDGREIMFTMEEIRSVSTDLEEYARRLESLLYGIWHEAMLPVLPQVPGYTAFTQPADVP